VNNKIVREKIKAINKVQIPKVSGLAVKKMEKVSERHRRIIIDKAIF